MKIKITLLIAFTFFVFKTSAQNPLSDFYKKIKKAREDKFANEEVFRARNVGFAVQDVQNSVFSPLVYIGGGMIMTNSKKKIYKEKIKTRTATFGAFTLNGFAAKSPFFGFNGSLIFDKKYIRNKNLSIGYYTDFNMAMRIGPNFQNNALQNEFGIQIGPSANYNFTILQNINTEIDVSLGAIGFSAFAPRYANSLDAFESKFTSLHNSLFPKTGIFFNLMPSKRYPNKRYRIGYQWQMAHVKRDFGNRYTLATHNFVLIGNLTKLK